jgi:hypothetical protein
MDRHDRETEDVEPGTDAVKLAQARIGAFAQRWSDSCPAAVRCLLDDRESLTVHLRFPREHWTRVRHSNFIERSFGESRRRVKVIGRLPGEHSCLSLVWRCLTALRRAGVGSPCPLPGCGCCMIYAAHCTIRQRHCPNGIRQTTPKPLWLQPIPQPPHSSGTHRRAGTRSGRSNSLNVVPRAVWLM